MKGHQKRADTHTHTHQEHTQKYTWPNIVNANGEEEEGIQSVCDDSDNDDDDTQQHQQPYNMKMKREANGLHIPCICVDISVESGTMYT